MGAGGAAARRAGGWRPALLSVGGEAGAERQSGRQQTRQAQAQVPTLRVIVMLVQTTVLVVKHQLWIDDRRFANYKPRPTE